MKIAEHLDKNNLHHSYLIEGAREMIVPEIIKFCESINIKTHGNPDFYHIVIDNIKIDEAFDLRSMSLGKSFSSDKKIFLICANSFSLDAQNVLLKMFEEPIADTHFFLIVPDTKALLKTLVSRFFLISQSSDAEEVNEEAEKFIAMPLKKRLDFIKELLTETEEEEAIILDSARSKSLKFLNVLEFILHRNFLENFERRKSHPVIEEGSRRHNFPENCFPHFFKVREFLRMPGSSTKSLMESVAIIVPDYSK